MNKKYIVCACALFTCFGCLKDINAGKEKGGKKGRIYAKNSVETPFSGWVASAVFLWGPAIVAASPLNKGTNIAVITTISQLGAQALFPTFFRSEDPGVSYRPASRITFFRHSLIALSWVALSTQGEKFRF